MSADPWGAYKQALAALRENDFAALQAALLNVTTDSQRRQLLEYVVGEGENPASAKAAFQIAAHVRQLLFLRQPAEGAIVRGQATITAAILAHARAPLATPPELRRFYDQLADWAALHFSLHELCLRAVLDAARAAGVTVNLSAPLVTAMTQVLNPRLEVIRLLLREDDTVACKPHKALLPLARAVHEANPDVVRLLLEAGADPFVHHSWTVAKNKHILTALELAVRSVDCGTRQCGTVVRNPSVEVVRELVRAGGAALVDAGGGGERNVRAIAVARLLPVHARRPELASARAAALRLLLWASPRARERTLAGRTCPRIPHAPGNTRAEPVFLLSKAAAGSTRW